MDLQWSIYIFLFYRSIVKSNFGNDIAKDPGPYSTINDENVSKFSVPSGEHNDKESLYESGPFAYTFEECSSLCSETESCILNI